MTDTEELILYPKLKSERLPLRKRLAAASVMDLLHSERPDLRRAELHWFELADAEDIRLWKKYQQQNEPYPFEHLLRKERISGLCDNAKGAIWLNANLDDRRLVEVCAHEYQHWASKTGSEAAAKSFGLRVADILAPGGGLFFAEEHERFARPGDSVIRTYHGGRKWIRGGDGSLRLVQPSEFYVSSQPNYQ